MAKKELKDIDAKLRRIEALVGERKRDDYETQRQRLTEARELFHEVLADRFTESFNAHLVDQPQATLREKQALTRVANADLRALGLAIRCPKTGEPAVLHADPGSSEEGRFQVSLISQDAGRKRTFTSRTLFPVNLMGHATRREPLAEYWADRVAKESRGRTKDS